MFGGGILSIVVIITVFVGFGAVIWLKHIAERRTNKNYERALKMVPMLIHLPQFAALCP